MLRVGARPQEHAKMQISVHAESSRQLSFSGASCSHGTRGSQNAKELKRRILETVVIFGCELLARLIGASLALAVPRPCAE